jgi:hypothetical protein
MLSALFQLRISWRTAAPAAAAAAVASTHTSSLKSPLAILQQATAKIITTSRGCLHLIAET